MTEEQAKQMKVGDPIEFSFKLADGTPVARDRHTKYGVVTRPLNTDSYHDRNRGCLQVEFRRFHGTGPKYREYIHYRHLEPGHRRCERTGNPCGTDTWAMGYTCPCKQCTAWIEELKAATTRT